MAIGLIMDGVGMSQDQYYQVLNQVTDNGTQHVPGILTRAAGPTEDGFCVMETWETPEALQHFYDTLSRVMYAARGHDDEPPDVGTVAS